MGGFGSGRKLNAKALVGECRSIDVQWLHRHGLLASDLRYDLRWNVASSVVTSVAIWTKREALLVNHQNSLRSGNSGGVSSQIVLDRTSCNYGGQRIWFLCPLRDCNRRCTKLYLSGNGLFACRRCHLLAYESQREPADCRAIRSADRIRARMGWARGILNGQDKKRHGMHWKTFVRLLDQHDRYVAVALAGHDRWCEREEAKLRLTSKERR